MTRSAAVLRSLLLSCAAALVPATSSAHVPRTLDDRPLPSLPPQLAAAIPVEASPSIEADPFALAAPIERLKLQAPPLNRGRFGLKTGLAIFKYANANPTRYIDPTGHAAEPASPEQYGMSKEELARWAKEKAQWEKPASDEARQSNEPVVVQEEEPVINRFLNWAAGTAPARKVLGWFGSANQGLETAGKAAEVIVKNVHRDSISKQDPADIETKGAQHSAFEGEGGLSGGRAYMARNVGRDFTEHSSDVTGAGAGIATREGLPAVAMVVGGRVLRAGGEVAEEAAALAKRAPDVPYSPRAVASQLEARFPGQVRSHTMVSNPSGRVLHRGMEILIDQRGFPVFDDVAAFQTRLPGSVAEVASRPLHMREATQLLQQAIQRGEVSARQFNDAQLRAIRAGAEKIPDFTWHHHQEFGRMQLIPSDFHQAVGHSGGFKLWY